MLLHGQLMRLEHQFLESKKATELQCRAVAFLISGAPVVVGLTDGCYVGRSLQETGGGAALVGAVHNLDPAELLEHC